MIDLFETMTNIQSIAEFESVNEEVLRSIIPSNTIYKYILFDDNDELNSKKLLLLEEDKLWCSYYKKLNDPNEFRISVDYNEIIKKTDWNLLMIKRFLKKMEQLYDVCSFTYEYSEHMWRTYANSGNGVCLVFDVIDFEYFYPIIYREKHSVNFTKFLISDIKSRKPPVIIDSIHFSVLAYLPNILKNPINGKLDSTKEKEVRALYCPSDDSILNGGVIKPNIKDSKKYYGSAVNYEKFKIRLSRIIVGNKCNKELVKKIEAIAMKKGIEVVSKNK